MDESWFENDDPRHNLTIVVSPVEAAVIGFAKHKYGRIAYNGRPINGISRTHGVGRNPCVVNILR